MRRILGILFLLMWFIACKEYKQLNREDYCEIYSKDQSYIGGSKLNALKREELFKENFDKLITELKFNKSLQVRDSDVRLDSCKYYAYVMTFTHIAQTFPEDLFNEKMIFFIKNKIDSGVIDKGLLFTACKISSVGSFKIEVKENLCLALNSWYLKSTIFNNTEFKY